MRVFVAGATGTLGRPVVSELLSRGHAVVGLTRSDRGRRVLEALGAAAVVGDALDEARIAGLVADVRPECVVHLLTALPAGGALRPRQLEPTNTLRTVGTAHLVRAATAAGVRRLVAESFVAVYGSGTSERPLSEDEPLPPAPRGPLAPTVLALRLMEEQLRAARDRGALEAVSLRIAFLYGREVPSTSELVSQARAHRLVAPHSLPGIASFVHLSDATSAIVASVERPAVSLAYNVADDSPLALAEFLELLTRAVGAPPPRRVPRWLVKLAAPVVAQMGAARLAVSNAKARRELGWQPRVRDVRVGLAELGEP